ncbi:MAG: phytoene/squalene synthase family protein [Paracoccaceae bacterium]
MAKPWSDAAEADFAACAEAIRHGSHSFHAAGRFLPKRLRAPAHAIYAFCRLADDAVDLDTRDPKAAVARLARRLDRVYDGRPENTAADRAFARTVERLELPKTLPGALIEGFDWDADGRRYRTLPELRAYAARVAGAVGGMMAVLMGARSEALLARATDLGAAMQLTNIARDVGEDARTGRIYLPLDWLAEERIDPAALVAAPVPSPAMARILARLLVEADRLYARAEAGIARLPADCRPAIFAARLLYGEIGAEVARNGYDSVTRRAVVPKARKLALAARAVRVAAYPRVDTAALAAPALPECAYLVTAAMREVAPERSLSDKALGVIDLFAELERRDRAARAAPIASRS